MIKKPKIVIIERDAFISECRKYRYLLRRVWINDRPRVLIVMLNPSIADSDIDDQTIRSCIRLCNAAGYGSFEVVNLFAFRTTYPEVLFAERERFGPDNRNVIEAAINRCDMVICAWGIHGGHLSSV